jgi:NAD+ diphosphatase
MPMASPNTFSGGGLDRAADRRGDPHWLEEKLSDPSSAALVTTPDGLYVMDGDPPRPALIRVQGLRQPVLLGVRDGRALFAADAEPVHSDRLDGAHAATLRDAGAQFSPEDAGLAAYAVAMLNWHRRNTFCGVCGTRTNVGDAGHLRTCPRCGNHIHPRTDPVVIVLVADDDRALLGRQPHWPEGRYSALAGFVEPGEAIEDAVAREVREEAGVEISEARYRSSQPWPFPASLMLGFHATYASGEPSPVDRELEDVRWFSRDELSEIAAGHRTEHVPPPIAIARRLIDEWLSLG